VPSSAQCWADAKFGSDRSDQTTASQLAFLLFVVPIITDAIWRHWTQTRQTDHSSATREQETKAEARLFIAMAGKMPMNGGSGEMGLPNFDFSALQNVLNVSAVRLAEPSLEASRDLCGCS